MLREARPRVVKEAEIAEDFSHRDSSENRGKRPGRKTCGCEAVGRATRGMDRATRGSQVAVHCYGTCETARRSIHVPAEGGRRPATHRRTSILFSVKLCAKYPQ